MNHDRTDTGLVSGRGMGRRVDMGESLAVHGALGHFKSVPEGHSGQSQGGAADDAAARQGPKPLLAELKHHQNHHHGLFSRNDP